MKNRNTRMTDLQCPPPRNPWLADSVYPISHYNSGATDSVQHAGPCQSRVLFAPDIKTIPNVFTCNPTLKHVDDETIVIAPGVDGIRKIRATGKSFELVSFLPYPGCESFFADVTPDALQAILTETNEAYRAQDDLRMRALSRHMDALGFNRLNIANGAYNLIDRDGFHYAAFDGLKIIKTYDNNDPIQPLRVVRVMDLAQELPPHLARWVTKLVGFGITYDGYLVAAAAGTLFLLDRNLDVKGILSFVGEVLENSICVDEQGIYLVTSKRMLKVIWTGTKLSYDEADGGWEAPYNTMAPERALAAGASTTSGGSGTTPALMGFGDDRDKLVVISDADPNGANLVAFWRDEIPADFRQKPGTRSRRIADQMRTDISKLTIKPSPAVLDNGVVVLNSNYPKPVPDVWGNAMTAGVTRPAPMGAQKFLWNSRTRSFDKAWLNRQIDNTDITGPVISANSRLIYLANKQQGQHEYVALDWDSGELRARWTFPDDNRQWNAFGGITLLLEDGDLVLGGLFALKRVHVGGDR